ncbi:hypothetical protein [Paenibacillus sp. FSL E2-0178]|uniref:hypothetical protein n=1 Tax=Paenibacillus sp. FSL E2-0178 TaxID=2921361 RepID=UPI003159657D
MKTTGNLGLKKPDGTDIVDITDLNGNMDILDTAVKAVQDHAADAVKHITAAERTAWNAKASTAAATASAAGLMAAADKAKLDGVAAGANNYVHPNHTGDVTSTGDGVTAIAPGVIVNADVNAAAAIDATKIGTGVVSNAEFGYLDGVTSGIQGQLNGKTNLTTTPQQTTTTITYYVRTDGSDSNTGLGNVAGMAFKTIGKAISMIPKMVNHTATINVAAGTYAEAISIAGFVTTEDLSIVASGVVSVTSVKVSNCHGVINITGLTATTTATNTFEVSASRRVVFTSCITTALSSSAGFYAGASDMFVNTCTISNRGNAVVVLAESIAYATGNAGVNNGAAYLSGFASYFGYTGTVPAGVMVAQDGATLVQGSGVLNPWGDNTTGSRSLVSAWSTSAQSFVANTWTKVMYTNEVFDNLGEYNPALHRFTAAKTGVYLVTAALNPQAPGANTTCTLCVWVNGGRTKDFGYSQTSGTSSTSFQGSAVVRLNPGDYVEIYAYANANMNGVAGSPYQYFDVVQVA